MSLNFRSSIITRAVLVLTALAAFAVPSSVAAEPTPQQFFGAMAAGMLNNEAEMLSLKDEVGVKKVRLMMGWSQMTKDGECGAKSGTYEVDFSYYDKIFLGAALRDLQVYPYFFGSCFAGGVHRFPTLETSGANYLKWLSVARQAVERYGVGGSFWAEHPALAGYAVTHWEIWNETNSAWANPNQQISPRRYAKFLIDTTGAIRQAPNGASAQVLIGGLAKPGQEIPEGSEPATPYTTYLYAMYTNAPQSGPETYTPAELKNSFDGMAIHPYALNGPVEPVKKSVEEGRVALDSSPAPGGGDDTKSLAITELGWPIKGVAGVNVGVTEIEQGDYLVESFNWLRSKADAWNIDYAIWYFLQDYPSSPPSWAANAGLKRVDGSNRFSMCAFAALMSKSTCPYIQGGYPTQTFATVLPVAHGQPGYVSVVGTVYGKGAASGISIGSQQAINIKFWKKEGGTWAYKGYEQVPVVNNHYEMINYTVGVGEWKTTSALWSPPGNPILPSESGEHKFTVVANGWHSDNLGGTFTADPDIASQGAGKLNIFGRGLEGSMWIKNYPVSGGYGPWTYMGGSLVGGPGAVSWGSGRIDVVYREPSNTVGHWYLAGSWGADNLGGPISSDVDISSWGPNRLDLFARSASGNLLHKYWAGSGWSGWENMGGSLAGGPGAVSWGPNRIDVVARMSDNTVGHWYWAGTGWFYDNLGGQITSDPDIASWGSGRLDVFARGTEGGLIHRWYPSSGGWSGWEYRGGRISSGPGAVSWGGGRIDVVAVKASDGSLAHWWFQ